MYIGHNTNSPNPAVSLESSALTGPDDSPAETISTGTVASPVAGSREKLVRLFFHPTGCQTASFGR